MTAICVEEAGPPVTGWATAGAASNTRNMEACTKTKKMEGLLSRNQTRRILFMSFSYSFFDLHVDEEAQIFTACRGAGHVELIIAFL
jgi:hypothetical protein